VVLRVGLEHIAIGRKGNAALFTRSGKYWQAAFRFTGALWLWQEFYAATAS